LGSGVGIDLNPAGDLQIGASRELKAAPGEVGKAFDALRRPLLDR